MPDCWGVAGVGTIVAGVIINGALPVVVSVPDRNSIIPVSGLIKLRTICGVISKIISVFVFSSR